MARAGQDRYTVMGYKEFGHQLLDTYDLDPLYVILARTSWPDKVLFKFLLGYWIYYSAGCACKLAESRNFYDLAFVGDSEHWPRGHERRHMRGDIFKNTVTGLAQFGPPEKVVEFMLDGKDFQSIAKRVQSFSGFGPWISWKVADMAERVVNLPVKFDNAEIGVYRDPVKGAALIGFGDQHYPIKLDEVHAVFSRLQSDFGQRKAPPYLDRLVNIQELETICCKWKSHVNGHYPLGLDTKEIYHGLEDGCGDLAAELKGYLKPYYELWSEND
jgi:hypothetical protein